MADHDLTANNISTLFIRVGDGIKYGTSNQYGDGSKYGLFSLLFVLLGTNDISTEEPDIGTTLVLSKPFKTLLTAGLKTIRGTS